MRNSMGRIEATGVLGVKNDRVCTFFQQKGPIFGQVIAFLVLVFGSYEVINFRQTKTNHQNRPFS